MGGAFGAGWTPCVGPILGSILLLAGQRGKAGTAALYLSVYSAGLGLPFLGGAIFFDRFLNHAGKLRARLPWIQRISGVLLIVMGFLITLGHFESLSSRILEGQYRFITWALGEGEPVPGNPTLGNIRFLPAAVLLLCGILPPLTGVFRKRPVLRPGILIPSGLFCLLAAAQAAGLIDGLRLLALWLRRLQYLGNL
jgi:cytochrome c-type biogenesis protein